MLCVGLCYVLLDLVLLVECVVFVVEDSGFVLFLIYVGLYLDVWLLMWWLDGFWWEGVVVGVVIDFLLYLL